MHIRVCTRTSSYTLSHTATRGTRSAHHEQAVRLRRDPQSVKCDDVRVPGQDSASSVRRTTRMHEQDTNHTPRFKHDARLLDGVLV